MTLRTRLKDHTVVLRVGLIFLLLANLSRYFFHPSATFSEGFVDLTTGLLFGLAIGSLLLSVTMKSRARSATNNSQCAMKTR
jgi:hypothetical protein